MPAPLPIDWNSIAALAASGHTLADLSIRFGVALPTLKARSRRGGWKTASRDVHAQRVEKAVAAGQMAPQAHSGLTVVKNTLSELSRETKLSLAKTVGKAAEHAATLKGADALAQARNIKETVGSAAAIHEWRGGESNPHAIIDINLIGMILPDLDGNEIDLSVAPKPVIDV